MRRREFLKTGASAGLLLAFHLPKGARIFLPAPDSAPKSFAPNAWLEIRPEGEVAIWCGRSEMGQGVRTSLPMVVAEELCCDWGRVRVVEADLDPKYGEQITGGSYSVRGSFADLQKAGAPPRCRSRQIRR